MGASLRNPGPRQLWCYWGLFAAFIGPELGSRGMGLSDAPFAGSFIIGGRLWLLILLLAFMLAKEFSAQQNSGSGRMYAEFIKTAGITGGDCQWCLCLYGDEFNHDSYAVKHDQFWDMMCSKPSWLFKAILSRCFLPSLFAASLLRIFAIKGLMLLGLAAFCASISIAMFGPDYWAYWLALVLLGCGWNFYFCPALHYYRGPIKRKSVLKPRPSTICWSSVCRQQQLCLPVAGQSLWLVCAEFSRAAVNAAGIILF